MEKYDIEIIEKTAQYVRENSHNDSAHDWYHIEVWKNAKYIWERENADLFIVELAILLHDIWDHKFNNWVERWPELAQKWLESLWVEKHIIEHVCHIIDTMWFKWTGKSKPKTLEWLVVQDADRLDSMWAITIWRIFSIWQKFWRPMYNPEVKSRKYKDSEDYLTTQTPEWDHTIKHFYDKLLLLKDLINTKTAKKVAEKRHKVMVDFLEEFLIEWDWKDFE